MSFRPDLNTLKDTRNMMYIYQRVLNTNNSVLARLLLTSAQADVGGTEAQLMRNMVKLSSIEDIHAAASARVTELAREDDWDTMSIERACRQLMAI